MKTTGERIKDIRLELGETLEQFGERFNTSKATVFNWEKGRNLPNKSNLKKVSEIGGVSVEELTATHSLGERIKRIRVEYGDNLQEFGKRIAGKMGIPKDQAPADSLVSRWEKGKNRPNSERLKAIAELGGITVNQLLNSNPLNDYSNSDLFRELERRGVKQWYQQEKE